MPTQEVTRSLARVKEAIRSRGFEGIYVTHYDNTPSDYLVLHDDRGHLARGDVAQLERAIGAAERPEELWSALDGTGLTVEARARHS